MMWALYYVGTPRLASSVQQVAGQNGRARQTTDGSGHTRGVSDVDIDQVAQRTATNHGTEFDGHLKVASYRMQYRDKTYLLENIL